MKNKQVQIENNDLTTNGGGQPLEDRLNWETPDFSEASVSMATEGNLNGNASDGPFFS